VSCDAASGHAAAGDRHSTNLLVQVCFHAFFAVPLMATQVEPGSTWD